MLNFVYNIQNLEIDSNYDAIIHRNSIKLRNFVYDWSKYPENYMQQPKIKVMSVKDHELPDMLLDLGFKKCKKTHKIKKQITKYIYQQ